MGYTDSPRNSGLVTKSMTCIGSAGAGVSEGRSCLAFFDSAAATRRSSDVIGPHPNR